MTQTLWNPWTLEYNELFTKWLRAAKLAGLIGGEFTYEDLLKVVDNAETLDLFDGLSREKALILTGLWMGRYQGNQDAGQWREKKFEGSELDKLKTCCQDFLEAADEGTGQEFWASLSRLATALDNIHPENIS